jgi:hypothetical protein
MTTIYQEVNSKRKQWLPIEPKTIDKADSSAYDLLSRCLSLRLLELPVRDFINDGLSRKDITSIGEEGKAALLRNTDDEERHDIALNNCVTVFQDYDPTYEKQASTIVNAWNVHPDHPILKAAVLENGIFFMILPLLRRFGGASLRTTSVDISADEIGHVILHRHVSQELGYKPSTSLDKLRKATVDWIAGSFSHPQITADKLRSASDNLMYRGIAPELDFTKTFQVPAFFERGNDTLPYYSA